MNSGLDLQRQRLPVTNQGLLSHAEPRVAIFPPQRETETDSGADLALETAAIFPDLSLAGMAADALSNFG